MKIPLKVKKASDKFFKKAYEGTVKYWYILIFISLAINIITIIRKQSSDATIWSIVFLLFTTIYSTIIKYHDYRGKLENNLQNDFDILYSVTKSVELVCANKLDTLITTIEKIKQGNLLTAKIVSSPCSQLKKQLEEIAKLLSSVLSDSGTSREFDDMYISLAYRLPLDHSDWQWVKNPKEQGLSIKRLRKSESTLNYVINSKGNYTNYKQTAYEEHRYVPDPLDKRDKEGKLKGSIACYYIPITKNDKLYIEAVLSISTYKHAFVEDKTAVTTRERVEDNIDYIVDIFSTRLKIELCLYYLHYLNANLKKEDSKIIIRKIESESDLVLT